MTDMFEILFWKEVTDSLETATHLFKNGISMDPCIS